MSCSEADCGFVLYVGGAKLRVLACDVHVGCDADKGFKEGYERWGEAS